MKIIDLAKFCKQSYIDHTFVVNECEVLIVENEKYYVVAVRGTEAGDLWSGKGWLDVVRDIRFLPWYDKDCGWCRAGFLKGGQGIAEELEKRLNKTKPIIFTGHSLGGAMSLIAAFKLSAKNYNVFRWVGIASPKLFLIKGRKFVKFSMINYRNNGDPVPLLPPAYSHDYDTIQIGQEWPLSIKDHEINKYIEAIKDYVGKFN